MSTEPQAIWRRMITGTPVGAACGAETYSLCSSGYRSDLTASTNPNAAYDLTPFTPALGLYSVKLERSYVTVGRVD